jgi:hypothetical protein
MGARAARQVALFVIADLLYESVRGLVVGRSGPALAHAAAIVRLERGLGVFREPEAQRLLLPHTQLVHVANWLYLNVQFTANAAFLAFLYLCRPSAYVRARSAMFAAMGIALVVHLLIPVAPPRMLTYEGFVDTVKTMGAVDQDSGALSFMVNPFAAVPSMHVCFACIVGMTGAALAHRRLAAAVWLAYPVLVTVIVVVTANHFFFDVVAGGLTAAVAWGVAGELRVGLSPQGRRLMSPAPSTRD